MIHHEIVWTYAGEDMCLGVYDDESEARDDFENGLPRVVQVIHGGTLKLNMVITIAEVGTGRFTVEPPLLG